MAEHIIITQNGHGKTVAVQKYLGKLENIAQAVRGTGPTPLYAEIFHHGLPISLWNELCSAQVIEITDTVCQKRRQGLSIGEYLSIAAINRAICAKSKSSMWAWFSKTTLFRQLPQASKKALSSQRFWDHMDRIQEDTALAIWKSILKKTRQWFAGFKKLILNLPTKKIP